MVFGAASEAFSQKNINCSIAESIERFAPVVAAAWRTMSRSGARPRRAAAQPSRPDSSAAMLTTVHMASRKDCMKWSWWASDVDTTTRAGASPSTPVGARPWRPR